MKIISCVLISLFLAADSFAFSGHEWVRLTAREKIAYVRGHKDGAFLGCFEALGPSDRDGVSLCAKIAAGGYDGTNIDDIISTINSFFSDPGNRDKDMVGIVGLAVRHLRGEDVTQYFPAKNPNVQKNKKSP